MRGSLLPADCPGRILELLKSPADSVYVARVERVCPGDHTLGVNCSALENVLVSPKHKLTIAAQ
jgi:hypothetical protein